MPVLVPLLLQYGSAVLVSDLPQRDDAALARIRHVSQANYVRIIFKEHLMALHKSDIGLNQSNITLQRFHSHAKQFILICRGVAMAARPLNTEGSTGHQDASRSPTINHVCL